MQNLWSGQGQGLDLCDNENAMAFKAFQRSLPKLDLYRFHLVSDFGTESIAFKIKAKSGKLTHSVSLEAELFRNISLGSIDF